ncbi:hypothetical protein PCANC_09492 [Puccinia coronata f. sp. avenae]|uniref:Uncharacterized protein n=1 Tax=Puccinia coronata f. sp. avenae TaxID=200324 RepID=A0A2N5VVQ9_9BASI|nr:hypothetical protein PCANC_09492 [Puccinia coronata f. sp. avenae]
MPPRKKKASATADDHADKLIESLKESFQGLQVFHETVTQKARNMSPARLSTAPCISAFEQLLDHSKTIIEHQVGNQRDNTRMVMECSGVADFFRYQIACLYLLPLKNIFLPLKPTVPVESSPILGLMNYICRVKLRENQAPLSVGTTIHSKQNARDIGQFWEKILVAFGDGIRLYINNAQNGSKLRQFQVLVGKVFYPFLAQVMGLPQSSNSTSLGEHVKRALLEAGEALSGACAENKELIREPTIFGPAILSHNISNHSDFITAHIALQLAFSVAPPIQSSKGDVKRAKTSAETRTAREVWFKQIFPVKEFGESFREKMVSRLVSMSSKQFWEGLGDIQEAIFDNDESRACAVPIRTGAIGENQIRFNAYAAPVLQSTVQFNKKSLTWSCLVSKQDGDSASSDEETTAEICYDAISVAQLTGVPKFSLVLTRDLKQECEEATLSIQFRSDLPIKSCAPAIYDDPGDDAISVTLLLKFEPRYAEKISRILKDRKIKFCDVNCDCKPKEMDESNEKNIVDVQSDPDLPVQSDPDLQRSVMKRETSKISISQEALCPWDAENHFDISENSNLRQRVKSVQREAEIDSSRGEDSIGVSEKGVLGTRDLRGPSAAEESISRSSPTAIHAGRRMSEKRKSLSRQPSPVQSPNPKKSFTGENKAKRVRIIESPDDPIQSPPVSVSKRGAVNENKEYPHSVVRSTHESNTKTPVVMIPTLPSVNIVKSRNLARQKSPVSERRNGIINARDSNPAKGHSTAPLEVDSEDSEDVIDSRSEPEDPADHVQPESDDPNQEICENIVESRESKPGYRDSPYVEDEIEQDDPETSFSRSSSRALKMKMDENSVILKKKNSSHSSVMNIADSFRLVDRKGELHGRQKAEASSLKDLSGPHKDLSRKGARGLKQNRNPSAENRAESDNSSSDIDIIEQALYDGDMLKRSENRKKSTDQPKPSVKKSQNDNRLMDLFQNLNTSTKKVVDQVESDVTLVPDSKMKHLARRSLQSIPSGSKKTAQATLSISRADLSTQETSVGLERSLNHVNNTESSGSKPFRGIFEAAEVSTTPVSRMLLDSSERGKKSVGKFQHPLKQKRLRFESPNNFSVLRNMVSPAPEKSNLSQRDTPPPADNGHIEASENLRSIKRQKLKSDIVKDEKDLSESSLKFNTPAKSTTRLDLKDFQKSSEKRKIGDLPMAQVEQEFPDNWHQSSSSAKKLSDRYHQTMTGFHSSHSDSKKENVSEQEEDISNCMNQLTQMVANGIKKKQAKVEGIAINSRSGFIALTRKFLEQYDQKSEELSDELSRCVLQRQDQVKHYLDLVKQDRIKIKQDLDRLKNYIAEHKKKNQHQY